MTLSLDQNEEIRNQCLKCWICSAKTVATSGNSRSLECPDEGFKVGQHSFVFYYARQDIDIFQNGIIFSYAFTKLCLTTSTPDIRFQEYCKSIDDFRKRYVEIMQSILFI
jgi:hypothetical protein